MGRLTAVLAVLALAGCGSVTFLGNNTGEEEIRAALETDDPLVDQVVSLEVNPTPGGVIVSAVGLPQTQGFWEADLIPAESADPGVLLLEFYIAPPLSQRPQGTQPSREVLAGAFYSVQDVAGIRAIAVRGKRNILSASTR
ncbi:MAG: hypothetical protein AAF264_05090 [Pseudomonadota bacterium]